MSDMTLAVQMWTLREQCKTADDLAATLDKIRRIGYTAIELAGLANIDFADIERIVKDSGLAVAGSHVPWAKLQNDLPTAIDQMKRLGVQHAVIPSVPAEFLSAEGLQAFVAAVPALAKQLAAEGFDLHFHNHNRELARIDTSTWLELARDRTAPEELKFQIDTHWIQAGGGDPAQWIRNFAGRIGLVHFKDMTITLERDQRDCPVGEGNMNFAEIIKASKEVGAQYIIVEQDRTHGRDAFECVASSFNYLSEAGLK